MLIWGGRAGVKVCISLISITSNGNRLCHRKSEKQIPAGPVAGGPQVRIWLQNNFDTLSQIAGEEDRAAIDQASQPWLEGEEVELIKRHFPDIEANGRSLRIPGQ